MKLACASDYMKLARQALDEDGFISHVVCVCAIESAFFTERDNFRVVCVFFASSGQRMHNFMRSGQIVLR